MFVILLFYLVIFAFTITVHEFAHGWVAYKLGDPTAKYSGRLSFNPLAHIDPVGTVILPIMMLILRLPPIGWAKPVPVNFLSLRNPKRDMLWVGLAGPAANFLLAVILSSFLRISFFANNRMFLTLFSLGILVNLILGVFNLIPVPPLDGSKILTSLLPYNYARSYLKLEPYGFMIIFALIWMGVIRSVIFPIVLSIAAFLNVDLSFIFR